MRFVSTGGDAAPADLRTALFQGLAPDGGLYLPESLVPLSSTDIASLRGASLEHAAVVIGRHLLGDQLDDENLRELFAEALDFPIPVVALEEGVYILELFHGPTAAFKDIAARVLHQMGNVCDLGVSTTPDDPDRKTITHASSLHTEIQVEFIRMGSDMDILEFFGFHFYP